MIVHGVLGLVEVCLLGVVPAVAVAGLSPATPFLAPLAAAAMAGIAATVEFGIGGSIGGCFTLTAIVLNLAAMVVLVPRVARRRRARSGGSRSSFGWIIATVAVVAAGAGWPLVVLRVPVIGYDTQAIWLVHAALAWAGHQTMVAGLTSKAYIFTNADYPPLVPGTGALTYTAVGHVDQRLAVASTVVLSACALAVLATGVLAVVPAGANRARQCLALVVVAGFCGGAFGISGQWALNGYTDTLWSASALAATVYGLVLPRAGRHLGIAGLCLAVAALTKNEGLIVSGAISALVALRYAPWAIPDDQRGRVRRMLEAARTIGRRCWLRTVGTALLPVVPGALWAVLVRQKGITSQLFTPQNHESIPTRLAATATAMGRQLDLAPAALFVLVVGTLVLRRRRHHLGLANPAWLWIVASVGLIVMGATYVLGTLEVHWWLSTSVARTTIFDQTAFLCDMTMWVLLAVGGPQTAGPGRVSASGVAERSGPMAPDIRRRSAVLT